MGLVLLELVFSVIHFLHLTRTQKIEMMTAMSQIKARNSEREERCRPSLRLLKLENSRILMITFGRIMEILLIRVDDAAFITNAPTAAR
jgi:hypothetical protein